MQLKDTIELMVSEDYIDRFKAEYWQTKIRRKKLDKMLKDYEEGILNFNLTDHSKFDIEILKEQFERMSKYVDILESRAEVEGIDLYSI